MSDLPTLTAAASPRRPWRVARVVVRSVAWLAVGILGIVLLAWLALHWSILPHIDRWRPLVEARTSQALGVPVRIGSISAQSSGWGSTLELRDVKLLDAQLRPALELPRVVASLSLRSIVGSLASMELHLAQLLIDGAQVEARRDTAGRLFIAGIDFSAGSGEGGSDAADWFFKQGEFVIRGGSLRWTDEQRGAPPLALDGVDIVVRNTLRRHALRLDATPPPDWGDRFTLRGEFRQRLLARTGDWRHWSGEAYAELPRADASQLRQHIDLPFELSQGVGALRAWLEIRDGAASGVTADLALRAVALRLGPGLEPLVVEQVQGRLTGTRNAGGAAVALRRFGFVTGDGVQWPPGDLELAWKTGSDGAASGGSFAAGRLDLAVIAQIATRLPLGEALRKLLRESAPQGIASEIKASWDGAVDAPKHYRVAARLSGLALDAHPAEGPATPGRPGLRNASLVLDASDQGGKATLEIRDGGIELPGVFDDAVVPLAELSARLQWRIEARAGASPALELQIRDARVANADAQGVLNATWRTGVGEGHARGGRFPGVLDLDATLTRGDALSAARYLPLGISEGARHYVQRAVQGGNVTSANFRIKGDLWDFPFRAGSQGSFRVAIKARDMTLAYMPGAAASASDIGNTKPEPPWPPMTQLSGELLIDGRSLEFRDVRARILGVELGALRGGIADLAERPLLKLQAQARGPVADMLRFVNTTPVGGWVDGALREATASANGDLKLSLGLPLRDMSHATVNGSLVLAGNDVRIRHDLPALAAAHGRVDFTEKSLSVVGAGARVLGGDTSFDGGSQPDGSLRFTAQGSVTADALRRAPELGGLARVAAALTGQAQYRLALGLVHGRPEFSLTSDLVGLALDLPAPLRKAAELPLALRIQSTLAPGAPTQDTLRFELGPVVQAQFQRDLAGDTPRVLRGGIGVFEAAPSPASGVAANASFASLDVDAWDASVTRLLGGGGGSESAGSEAFTPGGYAPTQVGMRAQEIVVGGRRFTRLTMGASQLEGQWRAAIDADQLAGYVEYRAAPGGAGLVHARLARVSLPRGEVEEVTKLLDERQASLPALDIVVDDFELRGKHLGRFEVQAVNRLAPEREWRLTRLTLGLPEATLTAQGRWGAPGPGPGAPSSAAGPAQGKAPAARAEPFARRAEFDFRLDLADSGALLDRLGTVNVVRGGKGSLQGQVAWLGSPLTPDFASMTGQFKVAIESGQFLQVQPGAARLLGVLSLQSFARRLTLDFRDLFEEGFAFDSVAGDVAIARGVASTNNLVMRGAQAAVLMEGSSDIGRETQDLRVVVVPEINAGAASLAYAVINPAIGLGTFLAQLFLRQPLIEASTREFHVSGPWADPVVVPVERSGARPDPAPATAAPGASSGAR